MGASLAAHQGRRDVPGSPRSNHIPASASASLGTDAERNDGPSDRSASALVTGGDHPRLQRHNPHDRSEDSTGPGDSSRWTLPAGEIRSHSKEPTQETQRRLLHYADKSGNIDSAACASAPWQTISAAPSLYPSPQHSRYSEESALPSRQRNLDIGHSDWRSGMHGKIPRPERQPSCREEGNASWPCEGEGRHEHSEQRGVWNTRERYQPRDINSPAPSRLHEQHNMARQQCMARQSPTPDPDREVHIDYLHQDVRAAALHNILDDLADRLSLERPIEVTVLRDPQTKLPIGRAIASFPRIADAIRFVRTAGPRIELPPRTVPGLGHGLQSEYSQGTGLVLLLRLPQDHSSPPSLVRHDVSRPVKQDLSLRATGGVAPASEEVELTASCSSVEPTRTLMLRRLHVDVRAGDVAKSLSGLDSTANQDQHLLRGIILVSETSVYGEETHSIGFAVCNDVQGARCLLDLIRSTSDFAVQPSRPANDLRRPRRTLVEFAEPGRAFCEDVGADVKKDVTSSQIGHILCYEDKAMRCIRRAATCSTWRPPESGPAVTRIPAAQSAGASKRIVARLGDQQTKRGANDAFSDRHMGKDAHDHTNSHRTAERKKVALNIAAWTRKQGELRNGTEPIGVDDKHGNIASESEQSSEKVVVAALKGTEASAPSPVSTEDALEDAFTDQQAMACFLCSRKFKSAELLSRHAKESALHRSNLADPEKRNAGMQALHSKRQSMQMRDIGGKRVAEVSPHEQSAGFVSPSTSAVEAGAAIESKTEPRYRDRAQERRNVFGSEAPSKRPKTSRTFDGPVAPPLTEVESRGDAARRDSSPDAALDSSNIGNRMLQMMGWSEGQGIGLGGTGRQAPVEAVRYAERAGLGSQGAIAASSAASAPKTFLAQAKDERLKRYESSTGST